MCVFYVGWVLTWLPYRLVDMMASTLSKSKTHRVNSSQPTDTRRETRVMLRICFSVRIFQPSFTVRWNIAMLLSLKFPWALCGHVVVCRQYPPWHTDRNTFSPSPASVILPCVCQLGWTLLFASLVPFLIAFCNNVFLTLLPLPASVKLHCTSILSERTLYHKYLGFSPITKLIHLPCKSIK